MEPLIFRDFKSLVRSPSVSNHFWPLLYCRYLTKGSKCIFHLQVLSNFNIHLLPFVRERQYSNGCLLIFGTYRKGLIFPELIARTFFIRQDLQTLIPRKVNSSMHFPFFRNGKKKKLSYLFILYFASPNHSLFEKWKIGDNFRKFSES